MSIYDLIAVIGPTASGKTELAAAIASRLGGEIISSRTFCNCCHLFAKEILRPVNCPTQLLERYRDYPQIDAIYLRLAWLQIDSGKYREAIATLDLIQAESTNYQRARLLRQALLQRPETAEKSPQTAGVLSAILPGAGHFYAGRPGQAISSFLLNAIFITGTVVAFKNDSPVLGGILVFFELGWYIGGIRSAAQAAREENEARAKKYRRELKQDYRLSLGLEPGNDRVAFSLRLSF